MRARRYGDLRQKKPAIRKIVMFTGIITDIGTIIKADLTHGNDALFEVESHYDANTLAMGASVSHQGVCLTLIGFEPTSTGCKWRVQVSQESLDLTTAKAWQVGTRLNLERALKMGDELGGHMVSGHIDGIGEIVAITPENESHRVSIKVPHHLAKYISPKGSVAIDGISLTINEVEGDVFGINVIPHTWEVTTLGQVKVGTLVNLEADQMARYVDRILSYRTDLRT
jgi:riboflavin synthase